MADAIDDIPLLVRREIEARIIAPFVDALARRFPRQEVLDVLRETVVALARQQAAALPAQLGGSDLRSFGELTRTWTQGGALEINILQHNEQHYDFNVTRCRYAEMYQRLGIPELGRILSCGRDVAAGEGFNAALSLTRTHTILEGADHCNFRYHLRR